MYRSYARLILDIWPGLVLGGAPSSTAAATEPGMSRPNATPSSGAPSQPSAQPSQEQAPVCFCSSARLGRPHDFAADPAPRIAAPIGCPPGREDIG